MGKLVVLKLIEGDFEQGFYAILQIGDENALPAVEITAKLPPNPTILRDYYHWQSIYRHLRLPSRPIGLPKQVTQAPSLEECHQAAQKLKVNFNTWLASDSFRPICEKWLEKLTPGDTIRVILQTRDLRLQKFPWHLWDLIERYPKAEIALSAPSYERVEQMTATNGKVKILAILGNSQGIDTKVDRILLENLPNADITFLVEPESKDLTDKLWEQDWQIFFFAGHSATQTNETGKIYINQTESLTISQLKYALKKAVERGLQLAIFNSCDGLGLAREFADLNIPQIVVMREPVPDRVAQQFLKYFLEAFARGDSSYLAVREARERLQALENQFPCATWLPVICQNPAELPLTWSQLYFSSTSNPTNVVTPSQSEQFIHTPRIGVLNRLGLPFILFASLLMTGLLMGSRYLGLLQSLEIQAFDWLMQMRPPEKPDSRLLIVTITEEDVRSQQSEKPRGSLSDKFLTQLLAKLEPHQPAAIGLDIYRDYPTDKKYPQLVKLMQNRLVAVCKVSEPQTGKSGVAPPPEVSQDHLGFSDILLDKDNVVRRHYLALTPPLSSPCQASYALSVQLALRYLYKKGVKLQFTSQGKWKLGQLKFKPLEAHTGAYQRIDALGHQILLNYRFSPSPQAIAPKITLGELLAGKLNAAAVKDKIILIGTTAESFRDYSLTPYTIEGKQKTIPGVILQAQMVSQLLSAVLDGRPLLWSWSIWFEVIWIWGWSIVGISLAWYVRRPSYLLLAVGIGFIILYGIAIILLSLFGCLIPLIPAALIFVSTNVITTVYLGSKIKQK
ncbi:CHASE2 domain-containing protein [Mastigocoleus testarum]|uniref:Sensor protein Chase2 n=1 Tax=Mastigocoleus testarum BC008 TaxID=371196 RepID=A0A0V7ZMF9_9CYAN|nr:CHASE2 domain-containing protein [Mastigocoleus testarum]KST65674.1 sensor protein Chase2 [Mastigocoleus testarum BC008]